MKTFRVTVPAVTKSQLLKAFERMCLALNKVSLGFDVRGISQADQWAMRYTPDCGWMVVCGLGGCGVALGRWSAYVQTRWNFMMLIEAVTQAVRK